MDLDLEHVKGILGDIVRALSGRDYAYARGGISQLLALLPPDGTKEQYETYLENSVTDAEFIAKKASKAGSWQAAIAAKRLALESRKELEGLLAKNSDYVDPTAMMGDQEIIGELVRMIPEMPEMVVDKIEMALEARKRSRPMLSVVTGGQ